MDHVASMHVFDRVEQLDEQEEDEPLGQLEASQFRQVHQVLRKYEKQYVTRVWLIANSQV